LAFLGRTDQVRGLIFCHPREEGRRSELLQYRDEGANKAGTNLQNNIHQSSTKAKHFLHFALTRKPP
jgi:hypothetical protein